MNVVVTVSQINRRLAGLVKGDEKLRSVSVKGEISNFKEHFPSGHMYFTLKEGNSSIKAVMFKSYAERLKIYPENGMNAVVSGSVQVYERDGACQLYATGIDRDEGIGEDALSFEQLKAKLLSEGLFEQKRPLPTLPKSICVVTSETGAALQDIINVLSRRYPFVTLKLVPVLVQGEGAPVSIAEGIGKAQNSGCDLIIFGRGGGSAEDLSAFNAEIVARAVYNSKIPTISAVGHEIDFTIGDFVADMRAPTPSAAAEIAVPDIQEIYGGILALRNRIGEKAKAKINDMRTKVNAASLLISRLNPKARIEANEASYNKTFAAIRKDFSSLIAAKESQLKNTAELIDAFNPLKTLERGYSVVYKDGAVVSAAAEIKKGDTFTVKMSDGEFEAVAVSDRRQ
ncbi:MAG: exodeoxyribonuclease VII large subunit [Ruminococcaceae bacterium]|nr:exodeoxyribonuclease VII large subunit [Oscillospiraceae bacterium]